MAGTRIWVPGPQARPLFPASWLLVFAVTQFGKFQRSSVRASHTARASRPIPSALLNSSPCFHRDNKKKIISLSLYPEPRQHAAMATGYICQEDPSGIWRFSSGSWPLALRRQGHTQPWSLANPEGPGTTFHAQLAAAFLPQTSPFGWNCSARNGGPACNFSAPTWGNRAGLCTTDI